MPKLHVFQTRFTFKDAGIPVFLDLFVYDHCDIANKDSIWNDWLDKCVLLRRQLRKSGITPNFAKGIDNPGDEQIVLNIIDSFVKKYSRTKKSSGILFGIENSWSTFPRIYANDFIFPLVKLKFEHNEYYAPNKWVEYLTNQYGNWECLPNDIGVAKHVYNYTPARIQNINTLVKKLGLGKQRIGYTAGAFDMFHIGHLNLLKRSHEHCDHLIVGVTTDELIQQTKNKKPVMPFAERMEIVRQCKYVEEAVVQDDLDKVKAWEKLHYDILFSGDDWKSSERWRKYETRLGEEDVKVIYFPYTQSTSSTKLAKIIDEYEDC
jgi:glycerol-3-phosphate cytidylyltransferase